VFLEPQCVAEPIDRGGHVTVAQRRHNRSYGVDNVGAHCNSRLAQGEGRLCFLVAKLSLIWVFDADLVNIFFPLQRFLAQVKSFQPNLHKITPQPKSKCYQGQTFATVKSLPKS
jgi:hypothetical protein